MALFERSFDEFDAVLKVLIENAFDVTTADDKPYTMLTAPMPAEFAAGWVLAEYPDSKIQFHVNRKQADIVIPSKNVFLGISSTNILDHAALFEYNFYTLNNSAVADRVQACMTGRCDNHRVNQVDAVAQFQAFIQHQMRLCAAAAATAEKKARESA